MGLKNMPVIVGGVTRAPFLTEFEEWLRSHPAMDGIEFGDDQYVLMIEAFTAGRESAEWDWPDIEIDDDEESDEE